MAAGLAVLSVLLGAIGSLPAARPVLALSGPVAEWTFDETSGNTAHDAASTHDGTVLGGATWSPTGGHDGSGALVLDGVDDGVLVPTATALEPTSISVSVWMKSNRAGDGQWDTLIQKGANGCEAGSYGLQAYSWADTKTGEALTREETSVVGNYAGTASPTARLWDDAWHQITWTFDSVANVGKLYVDGIATDTQVTPLLYGLPTATDLFIGLEPVDCGDARPFAGSLDDVRIFNRALSASEVQASVPAVSTTTTFTIDNPVVDWSRWTWASVTVNPAPVESAEVIVYDETGGGHVPVASWGTDPGTGIARLQLVSNETKFDVGSYQLVAEVSALGPYGGSSSSAAPFEVVKFRNDVSLESNTQNVNPGGTAQLTGTVSVYTDGVATFYEVHGAGDIESIGTAPLVFSNGPYKATIQTPALAVGDHTFLMRISETTHFAGEETVPLAIHVAQVGTSVTMVTDGVLQAHHPQHLFVSITPVNPAAPINSLPSPTGTVTYREGNTVLGVVDVSGASGFVVGSMPIGSHSLTAQYSGDSFYGGSTSPAVILTIGPDVVEASGIGVEAATFYPIVDGYHDTDHIKGTRTEALAVSIRIYNASNSLVRSVPIARAMGTYSWAWNGRNSAGTLLAAGKYRVVQTLTDAFGTSKTFTSYITSSWKKLVSHTTYVTKLGSAVTAKGSGGTGRLTVSTSTGVAKLAAGSSGAVVAGYQFTLPSATVYKSLAFQVYARASLSAPPNEIAVQNFHECAYSSTGAWNVGCFEHWAGIGTASGALAWTSIGASPTYDRYGHAVRGLVAASNGTVYVYKVRVKVVYATLQ